jgi:hypothetical protein
MLKNDVVVIHRFQGNRTLSFKGWLKIEHNVDIDNLSFEDHVKYHKLWIKTPHYSG